MKRLGKNHDGYHGETIDIAAVLRDDKQAARQHGWHVEHLPVSPAVTLLAFTRSGKESRHTKHETRKRLYLSTGIHGDEPAGPLAVRQLLQENHWPSDLDLYLCPCLNPAGLRLNRRENEDGVDLNRDYRHLQTTAVRAHIAWLDRQPGFDVTLCLHEDWEAHGFYVYELNPEQRHSFAPAMVEHIAKVCPIDLSPVIEGRDARGGIINPNLDPTSRPQWPEAFYLLRNKTRQSYTLEAPSDFPLATRVAALVAGVRVVLEGI